MQGVALLLSKLHPTAREEARRAFEFDSPPDPLLSVDKPINWHFRERTSIVFANKTVYRDTSAHNRRLWAVPTASAVDS